MIGEYLGIRPRYTDTTAIGGSSFVAHLHHAAAAIEAGLCEVALITYGSIQRSVSGGLMVSGQTVFKSYETPFRPRMPISGYALAASRHMYEFGTTREQLAQVAVSAREWAKLNPAAFRRDDLSIEDVLSSRMISDPLTLLDCCLVTDGGGAVVLTSAERARDLRKPPVYVLGVGEAHWHMHLSEATDEITTTPAVESAARAYSAAGLGPGDVDVVELYDAFTINTILFLEDLGFAPKGEGGRFVEGGRIGPGGESAGQHQRRRTLVLPPRHVRHLHHHRSRAPDSGRGRRSAGARRARRRRARQRRQPIESVDGTARGRIDAVNNRKESK